MTAKVQSSAANFYVGTMNKRAKPDEEKIREEKQLRRNLNTDKLENPEKPEEKGHFKYVNDRPKREKTVISAEEIHRQIENVKNQKSPIEVMAKCIRIAFKIIRGDNVPTQDDKFLFENEPEMHFKAWLMRQHKCDPEECESELDEEETEEYGGGDISFKVSFSGSSPEINVAVEALDISV